MLHNCGRHPIVLTADTRRCSGVEVSSVPTLPDNGVLGLAHVSLVPRYQRCGRYITVVVTLLWSSLHRRHSSRVELVADVTLAVFRQQSCGHWFGLRYQRCGRYMTGVIIPLSTLDISFKIANTRGSNTGFF